MSILRYELADASEAYAVRACGHCGGKGECRHLAGSDVITEWCCDCGGAGEDWIDISPAVRLINGLAVAGCLAAAEERGASRLRTALAKYGSHHAGCAAKDCIGPCSCGFDAAMKGGAT